MSRSVCSLEIRKIRSTDAEALARLFAALVQHGMDRYFHPHPLTIQAACERASYIGNDKYFIIADRGDVVGYGMLRGWDDGYVVPSLGIAIHPEAQGRGLARKFMNVLHDVAANYGAKRIRLRVHRENRIALTLYRSMGYRFSQEADTQYLVGFLSLNRRFREDDMPASKKGE